MKMIVVINFIRLVYTVIRSCSTPPRCTVCLIHQYVATGGTVALLL